MNNNEHELKIHPQYINRILSRQKTFEIRKNDRDFQVGDILILKEFDPEKGFPDHGAYITIYAEITYITNFMQKEDYVVLGIRLMDENGGDLK